MTILSPRSRLDDTQELKSTRRCRSPKSSGSYPSPSGLTAESGDESVTLSWEDMNFSGNVDYQFDKDLEGFGYSQNNFYVISFFIV